MSPMVACWGMASSCHAEPGHMHQSFLPVQSSLYSPPCLHKLIAYHLGEQALLALLVYWRQGTLLCRLCRLGIRPCIFCCRY